MDLTFHKEKEAMKEMGEGKENMKKRTLKKRNGGLFQFCFLIYGRKRLSSILKRKTRKQYKV